MHKELAKDISEDIKTALKRKTSTLYVCVKKQKNHFVKLIETAHGMSSYLDPDTKVGVFAYNLSEYIVVIGEDIQIKNKSGYYEIWKVVKVLKKQEEGEVGELLLVYLSSTSYIPGDK